VIKESLDIPLKHPTKVYDPLMSKNENCHEVDEEKFRNIMSNLDRRNELNRSPFFNKVEYKTKHGEYLSHKSLFQLGQITEQNFEEGPEATEQKQ